jgi:hypothetical protein
MNELRLTESGIKKLEEAIVDIETSESIYCIYSTLREDPSFSSEVNCNECGRRDYNNCLTYKMNKGKKK